MGYEDDFLDENTVEINIDGRIFKYKPTTGGDENEWLKDIMVIDQNTKTTKIDWSIYNKKKLINIKQVPYDVNIINKILGIEKDWKDLNSEQKYKLLSKLKPGLFDKIISAIKKIDEPDEKSVKN